MAKISPTIWHDELFRRIDVYDTRRDLVIVAGLRYPSDAAAVRARGGRIIAVTRDGLVPDGSDVTEAQRSKIIPDITVINNGALAALQATAQTVWDDIAAGAPKKQYHTA